MARGRDDKKNCFKRVFLLTDRLLFTRLFTFYCVHRPSHANSIPKDASECVPGKRLSTALKQLFRTNLRSNKKRFSLGVRFCCL